MIPEISIYRSLISDVAFTLSWRDSKSFDVHQLSKKQKEDLLNICGLELNFVTSQFNNEVIIQGIRRIIEGQASSFNYTCELFIRELSLPISRSRTYKGNLKNLRINNSEYVEKEYINSNNESFFASIAKLSEENFEILKMFFFNSAMNFAVLRNTSSLSSYINLDDIVANFYGGFGLNYLELVLQECGIKNNILLRAGGDGGKTCWSLQYFIPLNLFDDFYDSTTHILRGLQLNK